MLKLDACILGFKHVKALYAKDEDFGKLFAVRLEYPQKVIFLPKKVSCLNIRGCVYLSVALVSS